MGVLGTNSIEQKEEGETHFKRKKEKGTRGGRKERGEITRKEINGISVTTDQDIGSAALGGTGAKV